VKTTLVLKEELVRRAKQRAAELGVSLSELAERALRDALADRVPTPRKRVVLPTAGHRLRVREHSVALLKSLANEDEPV
jgi:hypothetical protein